MGTQVTNQGQVQPTGVPSGTAGASVQSGTTQNLPANSDGVVQPDYQKQIADLQGKLSRSEQDINRMKSSLQSREATLTRDWDRERAALQAKIDELTVQGMDETARAKYDAEKYQQMYEQQQQQMNDLRQMIENQRMAQDYVNAFTSLGISRESLDTSSPEALVQSGWTAVASEIQKLRNAQIPTQQPIAQQPAVQPEAAQPNVQPVTRQPAQAPKVVTQAGGSVTPTPVTMPELFQTIRTSLGNENLSEEAIFKMMENGKIDVNSLLSNTIK